MNNKVILDALSEALEMEEKGFKFYKGMSKKSRNKISQNTFDFLANNEILHIESIKNFYKSLKEKGEFPDVKLDEERNKRQNDFSIFSKKVSELKEKVHPDDDDKKACEFAMEFENDGYRYYKSMLAKAKDDRLIKLLKFLIEEEGKHYEGIMHLYTYLTDSENWFMYEENSFPQG